jgi:predicted PurR-regulated permease PerM
VVTGGKIAAEFFGGLVLMLFVTFFLIKDGERIWNWLLGAMRPETARRMDRAGHASWLAVVYYMRGTVAVAAIHAIVVGLALWIMGFRWSSRSPSWCSWPRSYRWWDCWWRGRWPSW